MHIIFSALMITNTGIIPSSSIVELEEGEDINSLSYKFRVRFWSKPHGTVYAFFLIGLVIFIVFKNTILLAQSRLKLS